MGTIYIYHFSTEEGSGEYIIISEEPDINVQENTRPGTVFRGMSKFEGIMRTALPLDYELERNI